MQDKQEPEQPSTGLEVRIRRRTTVGVIVSVLVILTVYLIVRPRQDLAEIAEHYLEPFPNVVAPIQQNNVATDQSYASAFQLYETGYYGKAEDLFRSLDHEDQAVQFYEGLNALLNDKPGLAHDRFGTIVTKSEHRFYFPALWYDALALLMLGDEAGAERQLQKIVSSNAALVEDAEQLLNQLR